MAQTINIRRAQQREKRLRSIELSKRKQHFQETDRVLELFYLDPERVQHSMSEAVLWEAPKAVKLYDAETGAPTAALASKVKQQSDEDEFPCLDSMLCGYVAGIFTIALFLVMFFIVYLI